MTMESTFESTADEVEQAVSFIINATIIVDFQILVSDPTQLKQMENGDECVCVFFLFPCWVYNGSLFCIKSLSL